MQIQGMKLMFYRPLSVHYVIQMNAERYIYRHEQDIWSTIVFFPLMVLKLGEFIYLFFFYK